VGRLLHPWCWASRRTTRVVLASRPTSPPTQWHRRTDATAAVASQRSHQGWL